MREIIFRAKLFSGDWVYGNFIHSKRFEGCGNEYRIHNIETGLEIDVIPDTVGQFTGLTDVYGKQIFEGDLVKIKSHKDYENEVFQVGFENGSFYLKSCNHAGFVTIGKYAYDAFWNDTIDDIDEINTLFEVVGNIHDNPELMK